MISFRASIVACAAILAGFAACGEEPPAAESGGGVEAATEDPRATLNLDPRLVLFDVQTRLESAREGTDAYPTVGEFTLSDTWGMQRDVLNAAFDDWRYTREGEGYRIEGTIGAKRYEISSPPP